MTTFRNPRMQFKAFYENPAIELLANMTRWTISGRLGNDLEASKGKAPIDMRRLIDFGLVRGAWARDDQCLVTLDELTTNFANATNAAFFLRSNVDGLMVIDIEPDCPPEISANLLALPGWIYSETSMSGRGYHLVTPLPSNFHAHRLASGKHVLREKHGWYELLLEHWVTFTRRPIEADVMTRAESVDLNEAEFSSIDDVYASLAATARESKEQSLVIATEPEMRDIPYADTIVERMVAASAPRFKNVADFNNDLSRWEFSVLGVLYFQMRPILVHYVVTSKARFSQSDQAWLLYKAAVDVLPARSKHNEARNRRPFLLDRAVAMIREQQA